MKRAVFAAAPLFFVPLLHAASATWNIDADGSWATGSNWTPTAAPGSTSGTTNTDTASFGLALTVARAITVDANRNIGGINFTNTSGFGYTLSGGNLLLTNGGIIQTSGAGTAHTDTINSSIAIQGNAGAASFIANSTTAARLLSITGGVTGVSTGLNVTTFTLNGTNTGANIVSGVIGDGSGGGKLGLVKSGAGSWTLSGPNSYTGNTTISAGVVNISNATSFGTGIVSITGNSRINAAALTYGNNISIDASRVLTLGTTGAANSTSTFSGAITGAGGITLAQGALGGTTVALTSTNNTFTGNITLPSAAGTNDFINFASIGDGGSIIFGRASWLANVRYTGSADLEFNTRTISLATTIGIATGLDGGGNPSHMFENNGAGTVTINTAMGVTSTTTSTIFFLGGNNAGNNTFAGAIADPTGANTLGIGKSGTGKWILSNNTNSYEGNVLLFDGTLSVGDIDVAANAQSLGKGSIIAFGYRTANTGTLEYTGAADAVTDKQIEVGRLANANNNNFRGGAVILNNGDGTLSFSNTTFNSTAGVSATGTGHVRTLTLGGTNTGANTISGTIQNNNTSIGAQVSLAKTGLGTWVLSGTNSYTGGTSVSGGTLTFLNTNAKSGTGTHAFGAGTTLGLGVSGASAFTSTDVTNAFAGNMSGNLSGITVTSTTNVGIDTTAGDFTYSGSITGSPTKGLTKLGANTLTLTGTNTYTGPTLVSAGTLIVNGSISTSILTTVAANATIGGSGTVGALTIQTDATVAPGNSPGILTVNGAYTQMGLYEAEIEGTTPGNMAGNHDQIIVNGTVDITGGSLDTIFSTFTPVDGDLIFILLNDGTDAITGTFNGFAQGAVVDTYNGFDWTISYIANNTGVGTGTFTGGNDIALLAVSAAGVIPEPSTALLGALGALLLFRRRR